MNRIITDVRGQYIAFFIDRYEKTSQANIYHLFEGIYSKEISKIRLVHLDRHIIVEFKDHSSLRFLLYPPHANVVYEDKNIIRDAFKRPDELRGAEVPHPVPARLDQPVTDVQSVRDKILHINPLLPREHLDVLIHEHNLQDRSVTELHEFVAELDRFLRTDTHPRWLTSKQFTTLPPEILPIPTEKGFDSVNEGIKYTYYYMVFRQLFEEEKESMLASIRTGKRKHQIRLNELNQSYKSVERADRYERFGHLLIASAHRESDPSATEIELPDYFNNNKPVQIALQRGKGLVENANYYYDKARKSRRSAEEAEHQKKQVMQELDRLIRLEKEVAGLHYAKEFNRWQKSRHDQLVQLGLVSQGSKQNRIPFRRLTEAGYELWIGKNASSNDELTLRAHKEDIWMHARGYPGSHVVIRMSRSRENPPRDILLKAASYAAWFSRARGVGLVPVSYTRRKYVHKPKGADPGQVVIDREDVVMVVPEKPVRK